MIGRLALQPVLPYTPLPHTADVTTISCWSSTTTTKEGSSSREETEEEPQRDSQELWDFFLFLLRRNTNIDFLI